jgi:hypothetical protein
MYRIINTIMGLLFVSALAMPHGYASEVGGSGYEENLLNTLHYRSAAGDKYLSLSAVTRLLSDETTTESGETVGTLSRTSWEAAMNFEYGWSDVLLFGIQADYSFGLGTMHTTEPSGVQNAYSSNGISDPTLHVDYRYWGGLTGTKFGSAYVNLTPAIGSQKNPDSTQTGNNLSGGSSVAVGTNLYWVLGAHEFGVAPALHFYTAGQYNDQNPANTSNFDSYFNANMVANYRYHVCKTFHIGGNINIIAPSSVTYVYGSRSNELSQTVKNPFNIEPTLTAGWLLRDNVVVSVQYSYNAYTTTTDQTSNTSPPSFSSSWVESTLTLTGVMAF